MKQSIRTDNQTRKWKKVFSDKEKMYVLIASARYDDSCHNGYNSFSLTAEVWRATSQGHIIGKDWIYGGCLHDEIIKHIPELAPYVKWHLTSSDGPMHYLENTLYNASERDCWGLLKGEFRPYRAKDGVPRWSIPFQPAYALCNNSVESETEPAPVTLRYQREGRTGEGKARDLAGARVSAVWPEATDEELTAPNIEARLNARLPKLLEDFRQAMESLGFTY